MREYGHQLKAFTEKKDVAALANGIALYEERVSSMDEVNHNIWLKRIWDQVKNYSDSLPKDLDPAVVFFRPDEPG